MKKVYSTILVLATMVSALSLTACGGDDKDDDFSGNDSSGEKYISVSLQKAGTLSSKISKTQASNLLRLRISGHMDARDFDFIKWDCMKVEEVDLSEVIIDSYSGVEGTEEGNNKTYAADEIPSGAFFYWNDVHKYVYDEMPVDEGMASLKKIVLPNGIKAIRRNAFARAYNLTEINIPDGVESIDYVAFAICTSLEEVKLPASLKTIGKQAFADMKSMKRFYVSATTPPTAYSNSFQGIPSDAVLYVPCGTENKYRNDVGWNTFSTIVGFDDGGSGVDDGNYNDNEYFEIFINGEKYTDEKWCGSGIYNLGSKMKNGMEVYAYGGVSEIIKISEYDGLIYHIVAGYITRDMKTIFPHPEGTYEIIGSGGQYVVSDYPDDIGMMISGGNISRRTVTSGSLKITKVTKFKDPYLEKTIGREYSYASEGTFTLILTDNWNGHENEISGRFRVSF